MAKPDIWMPLYIGDYLADTMELNTEQHGAYLLLIMAYWKNGCALPNDDRKLAAISRLGVDAWSMHKHTLASFFDCESDPELWIHARAEKEMEKAGINQEKRTLRAKKAAEARWGKDAASNAQSNAPSIQQAMLNECPSPSPSYKDQNKCPQQADDGHKFRFAEIQAAYNRICGGKLPKCAADNKSRRAQVKQMVDLEFNGKKPFREFGMEMWESYFTDCLTNPHWIGESPGGWKADFDFLTKTKNAIKLLERML